MAEYLVCDEGDRLSRNGARFNFQNGRMGFPARTAVRQIGAGSPVLFVDTTGNGQATRQLVQGEILALLLSLAD